MIMRMLMLMPIVPRQVCGEVLRRVHLILPADDRNMVLLLPLLLPRFCLARTRTSCAYHYSTCVQVFLSSAHPDTLARSPRVAGQFTRLRGFLFSLYFWRNYLSSHLASGSLASHRFCISVGASFRLACVAHIQHNTVRQTNR